MQGEASETHGLNPETADCSGVSDEPQQEPSRELESLGFCLNSMEMKDTPTDQASTEHQEPPERDIDKVLVAAHPAQYFQPNSTFETWRGQDL